MQIKRCDKNRISSPMTNKNFNKKEITQYESIIKISKKEKKPLKK